ncbi:MAG: DNA-3-methyladenine glycosylase [Candidatus Babeliales bacterium]|nr:DNA-3-methyladenine glycosylase [Candidatus Babeliales bacterium]
MSQSMDILPRTFYERDTVLVAQDLLGKILVRKINNQILSGMIIETEAYKFGDPACHACKNITERNKGLFGEVGRAYVYFTYGNHYCLNAVARDLNTRSGGILIRAIKPIEGIEFMIANRRIQNLKTLTNGPGKLAQALQINNAQYGIDLTKEGELYITEGIKVKPEDIIATPRIGITKATENLWRFILKMPDY